jgi:multiple sugar transport system substrate-binding protein
MLARLTRRGLADVTAAAAVTALAAACAPQQQAQPSASQPTGSARVTGKLSIVQISDFHPDHNKFVKDELTKFATEKSYPFEISDMQYFLAGGDIYQKLLAQKQAGQPIDLMIHNLSAPQLALLQLAKDQTSFVNDVVKKYGRAYPSATVQQVVDGKWQSVPFYSKIDGWWARDDMFKAAGVNVDRDLDTWEGVRDACMKVSDPDKKVWGWGMTVNRCSDGELLAKNFVWAWGGALADRTGQLVALNSPETIAALNFVKETYTDKKWEKMLPPGVNSWTDTNNNESFLASNIAFTQNAGTLFAKAKLDGLPWVGQVKFVPQPLGGAKQRLQGGGGFGFYFFDGSKNYDASRTVAEHMLTIDVQRTIWKISSSYAVPCYEKWWDDALITGDEISRKFKSVHWNEPAFPGDSWRGPVTVAASSVMSQNVFTDMIGEVLAGKAAAQAVKDAHDRSVKIYKEMGFKGA